MIEEKNRKLVHLSTLIVLILLLTIRVWVHQHFSGKYVDSDETVNWVAAADKAEGTWHTPYFYGQTYNVSLESISSAIFIKMGLPVEKVVPITTNVLGVLPFLFLTILLLRLKLPVMGLAMLVLGVVLPTNYHLITSLSRGFIGGITVASFGLLLLYYRTYWVRIIGFIIVGLSYWINPNVVVLLIPILIYTWFTHRHYLIANRIPLALGVIITSVLVFWVNSGIESEFNVHNLWGFEFHIDYLIKNLQELDSRFLFLMPFAPKHGGILAISMVLFFVYFLIIKAKKASYITLLTVLFIGMTLSLNKTLDGTDSVFFPYSRMYLALPFLIVLFLHLILDKWVQKYVKPIVYTFMIFAVVGFSLKWINLPEDSKIAVRKNSGVVQVLTIDKLCKECDAINALRIKHESELVVFHSKTDEYTYGCAALIRDLHTLYPEYDRRLWEYRKSATKVYPTILFLDWSLQLDKEIQQVKGDLIALKNIPYPAYLLQNNTQTIEDIYLNNQLVLRPH